MNILQTRFKEEFESSEINRNCRLTDYLRNIALLRQYQSNHTTNYRWNPSDPKHMFSFEYLFSVVIEKQRTQKCPTSSSPFETIFISLFLPIPSLHYEHLELQHSRKLHLLLCNFVCHFMVYQPFIASLQTLLLQDVNLTKLLLELEIITQQFTVLK